MPNIDPDYEIKNDRIQKALRYIAAFVKDCIPYGWGFTLLLFEHNKDDGGLFYISDSNRADVIKSMEEFIAKERKKM